MNKQSKSKKVGWFLAFYGISTFVGYLMPKKQEGKRSLKTKADKILQEEKLRHCRKFS